MRVLHSKALHVFEVGTFRGSDKSHGGCEFLWCGGGRGIALVFAMHLSLYVVRGRSYSVFEE